MEQASFIIETTMENKDYRKFLYAATFLRRKKTIPLIGVLALVGTVAVAYINDWFDVGKMIALWVYMFALAIGAICFKVEQKNKRRIKTDHTGTFGSVSRLTFYEEYMIMENEAFEATSKLAYNKFYELFETRDYLIFYINANQASLIRKSDVKEYEAFHKFIMSKFEGKHNCRK